jgi:hypothetical protein
MDLQDLQDRKTALYQFGHAVSLVSYIFGHDLAARLSFLNTFWIQILDTSLDGSSPHLLWGCFKMSMGYRINC